MDKRFSLFCVALLFLGQALGAPPALNPEKPASSYRGMPRSQPPLSREEVGPTSIQARAAAFFPFSNRFKKPYGSVVPNYQFEVARRFDFNDSLEFWANVNWTPWRGPEKSYGHANINLVNLNLGGSAFYRPSKIVYIYTGVGVTSGWVWLKDCLYCCTNGCGAQRKYHRSAFVAGGVGRTGVQINPYRNFFIDISVEYLYQIVFFHPYSAISGIKTGAGLGWRF